MILVDSNVWIDVLQRDAQWMEWSLEQLALAAAKHKLIINPVICAELATNFDDSEQLSRFVKTSKVKVQAISLDCAYLAGCAHLKYRENQRKNKRLTTQRTTQQAKLENNTLQVGVLADFFIGAHAQTEGMSILTRDAARYKTYFPSVELICP